MGFEFCHPAVNLIYFMSFGPKLYTEYRFMKARKKQLPDHENFSGDEKHPHFFILKDCKKRKIRTLLQS